MFKRRFYYLRVYESGTLMLLSQVIFTCCSHMLSVTMSYRGIHAVCLKLKDRHPPWMAGDLRSNSVLPYSRHSSVVEDSPKGHRFLQFKSPSPQKQREKETKKIQKAFLQRPKNHSGMAGVLTITNPRDSMRIFIHP